MPLACDEPRSRIEANPARSRKIGLAPSVKIREVGGWSRGPVERRLIGRQLDQVSGHEPCGDAEMTQHMDQEPCAVATGSDAERQSLLRILYPRLHPDHVADVAREPTVEADQEIDAARPSTVDARQEFREQGPLFVCPQEGRDLLGQCGIIDEGHELRVGLEKKIEGIDDGHVRDEVDGDLETIRLFRDYDARDEIALRVLLPVQEMAMRFDLERIGQDRRARMRRRPEPNGLRPQRDRPVVAVEGTVAKRDMNAHDHPFGSWGDAYRRYDGKTRTQDSNGRANSDWPPITSVV